MLTDRVCKTACVPEGKRQIKLTDNDGLVLVVGKRSKTWIVRYRLNGKSYSMTIGKYPGMTLKEARGERNRIKDSVARGIPPTHAGSDNLTFRSVAEEWMKKRADSLAPKTRHRDQRILEMHLFPHIGDLSIDTIRPRQVLDALEIMEAKGIRETTHKAKQLCSSIFNYAAVVYDVSNNPVVFLTKALKPVKGGNRAAVTEPKDVARLMQAISCYDGSLLTKIALQFSAYVFARPGEVRHMEWQEFYVDDKQWKIPARKMKMGRDHIVPLSTQAVDLLQQVREMDLSQKYVFPNTRSPNRPMSENTVNAAIRYLGFEKHEMCAHGFRAMARTFINERGGWPEKLVEFQLAHFRRDSLGRAYDRTLFLEDRTVMMQAWADCLDYLAVGDISSGIKALRFRGLVAPDSWNQV